MRVPILVLLLFTAVSAHAADTFESLVVPFVKQYCASCHDEENRNGEVVLTEFTTAASFRNAPEVWEFVLDTLRDGFMPPREARKPDPEALAAVIRWLEKEFQPSEER
jgi:hypothetical protein